MIKFGLVVTVIFLISCSSKEFFLVNDSNLEKTENMLNVYNDTCGCDSLGNRQGYWKTYSVINYRTDKGFLYYVEGYEYGYYKNGKKEGGWIAKDKNNNIIGYITYEGGLKVMEIQIMNKKVISIIKIRVYSKQEQDTSLAYGRIVELISFNKRGKLRSRSVIMQDSVVFQEFY